MTQPRYTGHADGCRAGLMAVTNHRVTCLGCDEELHDQGVNSTGSVPWGADTPDLMVNERATRPPSP